MADERSLEPHMGAELHARPGASEWDGIIAGLAERQHGVIARRQLLEIGLGRRAIGNRLEKGRLHAVHRGVYAVGHRMLTVRGRWMAAVLAASPGSVLSHRSAGSLWGVLRAPRPMIDVTVQRQVRVRSPIAPHRSNVPADETTIHDGIPVTSVSRTLLDLAAVLPSHRLERAMEEAESRRLLDPLSIDDLLARHPRRRGTAALRAILSQRRVGSGVTRSELEDRFLAFLDANGLPRPEVNVSLKVRGRWLECDFVWRSVRLIVELDGRATHNTTAGFERDRARDRALNADGWRVVRVTWRHLHADGRRLEADLRDLLGVNRRPGAPSGDRSGCGSRRPRR